MDKKFSVKSNSRVSSSCDETNNIQKQASQSDLKTVSIQKIMIVNKPQMLLGPSAARNAVKNGMMSSHDTQRLRNKLLISPDPQNKNEPSSMSPSQWRQIQQ